MPFEPEHLVENYYPSPPPIFENSERQHYDREFRNISKKINKIVEAVREMQEFLDDNI